MKNLKIEGLSMFFKPISKFFMQHGIAATFPIMVVCVLISGGIYIKRRKKNLKRDTSDLFLILFIVLAIIIYFFDQYNFSK